MKTPAKTHRTLDSNRQAEGVGTQAPPVRTGWSLRFWQCTLATGFLCLLLTGVALFRALPAPGRSRDASTLASARYLADHSFGYYIQSGQWRADIKTLASMVHYLVTPETVTTTNRPVLPA